MGLPLHVSQTLKRSKRWSILPAYTMDGYIAWEVHHGSITKDILDFMRTQVLPQCTPEGEGPRSIVVMDNARIHQSAELDELCSEFGVLLVKLPPYSPDYNPIETSFAVLKAWIKRNNQLLEYYPEERGGFGTRVFYFGLLTQTIIHRYNNLAAECHGNRQIQPYS